MVGLKVSSTHRLAREPRLTFTTEETNQTAWLERGGRQKPTQPYQSFCKGGCAIPTLAEIREERADPGDPVLIEGSYNVAKAHDHGTDSHSDELDDNEQLSENETSLHCRSCGYPSPANGSADGMDQQRYTPSFSVSPQLSQDVDMFAAPVSAAYGVAQSLG